MVSFLWPASTLIFLQLPYGPVLGHLCSCHLPLWNGLGTEQVFLAGQRAMCSDHLGGGQRGLAIRTPGMEAWSIRDPVMPPPSRGTLSPLVSGVGTMPVPSVPQSGWL